MHKIFISVVVTTIILIISSSKLQAQGIMDFVNYPGSISSMGMGQQSVALPKYSDALTFNPANLIFTKHPVFSFYHRQFAIAGTQIPMEKYSGYFNVENVGAFGVEFLNRHQTIEGFHLDENQNLISETQDLYDRSFALGFARKFAKELTAGISFRYARIKAGGNPIEHYSLSGGFNYIPDYLSKKINIGFSLTNFSNAVELESRYGDGTIEKFYESLSSNLNLGIYYSPVINEYFTAGLQAAINKPIYEIDSQSGDGKSSFKALFTDWKDFPKDVNVQTGIAFEWNPLSIGKEFSFFQNYYVGNQSNGIKNYASGILTQGAELGFEYKGYKLTTGYTGIWHLVHNPEFVRGFLSFPMESFQFTFGLNESILFKNKKSSGRVNSLKNIIVTLGAGQSLWLGRYKEISMSGYSEKFKNSINYNTEAAFYMNERNSLVASINYSSIPFEILNGKFKFADTEFETFTFTSQYRYHPIYIFLPVYLQGGLGIIRYNPTVKTSPRYEYKSTLHFSVGGVLDFFNPFIINPEAAYTIMFNTVGQSAPRLGGFNQFDLRIKLGYKF